MSHYLSLKDHTYLPASNLTHTLPVPNLMLVCYHQMTKTGITVLLTTKVRKLRLKNWMEDFVSLGAFCAFAAQCLQHCKMNGEHRSR